MEKLLINGGKKLFGELEIGSAKNSFLPILAGCILVDGVVRLHKYPNKQVSSIFVIFMGSSVS